jgi:hypothetical protein
MHNSNTFVAAITTLILASSTSFLAGCNKQQTDTAYPEPEAAPVDYAAESPVAEEAPAEEAPVAEAAAEGAAADAPAEGADAAAPAEGEAPPEG